MKTYKYLLYDQSNTIRLGNLLDDMWQVHEYFHKWQRQRYKDGLPYAGYEAMCVHVTELKHTTHPHWNALPKHKRLFKQINRWMATTKPCSDCGFHNENLMLNDRRWTCPECGADHDRDINAAINILRAGIAIT